MNESRLNALKTRPFVLDAYYMDQNNSVPEIVIQGTLFVDPIRRRIYINYYNGEWLHSWITLQDKKIDLLNSRTDWNQLDAGRMISHLADCKDLVAVNRTYIDDGLEPIYDCSKGLRGIYLTENELDQFFDTASQCLDIHKLYILTRHHLEEQFCASLDQWMYSDSQHSSVWALHKSIVDNELY
jgi:hypothetical protein